MLRVVTISFLSILITALPVLVETSKAAEPQNAKRYQVKSGSIEYTLSGAQVGVETLYFDDWGRKEARVTKTSTNLPNSQNSSDDRLALIIDGKSINVDLNTNKGTIADNREVMAMSGDTAPRSQMSAPINQTNKIAGKDCTVWKASIVNSEVCLWNNIPLKTVSGSGSTTTTKTAAKISLNTPLPKTAFDIPQGAELSQIQISKLFEVPNAG